MAFHRSRDAWGLGVLCLLLGSASCSTGDPDPARPNLVLVSVDTLRADAPSAFGGPAHTPALEGMARDGVVFGRAWAPAPTTAASHASLFTGMHVARHGVLENGRPLPGRLPLLASAFRDAGYRTAAFVSSFVMAPRFGWDRGFEHFDAEFPEEGATWPKDRLGGFWTGLDIAGFDRRADATTRAALDWLQATREPFFLFVHYFDPHAPYTPPRRFLARVRDVPPDAHGPAPPGVTPRQLAALKRRYHAEVAFVDEALGALAEGLERSRRPTLLVLTGDHGEGLGQHGWLHHWANLYEELLRVPLLFHWIGEDAGGRRIDTPVGLVDVAPTLLDLAGLPPLPGADGRSLAPSLRGDAGAPARALHAHRLDDLPDGGVAHMLAVREGGWKLIREGTGRERLFHLASDPGETRDLRSRRPARARRLARHLDRIAARAVPAEPARIPPEVREGLEALGYVDPRAEPPSPATGPPRR